MLSCRTSQNLFDSDVSDASERYPLNLAQKDRYTNRIDDVRSGLVLFELYYNRTILL